MERTEIITKSAQNTRQHHSCGGQAVISPAACRLKRSFDIVLSLLGLILFSPAFVVICIAIKREDCGTIIFRQERIGYKGRPFMLYKFRSMIMTAEADGKPALCRQDDKRLTRVGRFLREHHLDELPQLWNVLKGEMSLWAIGRSVVFLWTR